MATPIESVETVNLPMGAMDIDAAGVFVQLRASWVRLRRISATHLVMETPNSNVSLHITSHFQLDVKTDSGHGAGR